MNSVGQTSLQFVKTVHLYKRERHLCLQVNIRIHVIPDLIFFLYFRRLVLQGNVLSMTLINAGLTSKLAKTITGQNKQ